MTAPTIPGDHLTSEDAGFSDSDVGSEPTTRTRAVVQVAQNGDLSYYADGDIDFLVARKQRSSHSSMASPLQSRN